MTKYFLRGLWLLIVFTVTTSLLAQDIHQVKHDDGQRGYILNVPENYDSETPLPLVIALHGAGGDGISLQLTTRFDELANEKGWLSAFPTGIDNGWDYLDAEDLRDPQTHVDDVGFINAMIDDISEQYQVDAERIYVVGYSNGALLALRLGCDLADRLDGVVAIAGTYSFEIIRHCTEQPPVSLLLVWGTEDDTFPINGFVIENEIGRIRSSFSMAQTRSYIATHYGCGLRPQAARLDVEGSPYPVVMEHYNECSSGASATILAVVNHGHGFPIDPRVTRANGEVGDIQDMIFDFLVTKAAE